MENIEKVKVILRGKQRNNEYYAIKHHEMFLAMVFMQNYERFFFFLSFEQSKMI